MFNAVIERCNAFAQTWTSWVGRSIVDAAIVLAIVSLVWWAIRRKAPPQLGYLLFLLVPLKLFIPLYVSIPDRFFSWAPRMAASGIGHDAAATAPPLDVPPGERDMMFPRERAFDLPARAEFKSAGDDRGASPKGNFEQPAPLNVARRAAPSLFAWLMFAWVLVIFAFLVRLALAQLRFHRGILRDAKTVSPIELPIDFAELLNRMRVGRQIRIVESDRLSSPVVWGMFRPVLILPAGFAASMSAKRLEWVLLHELAHVKRRDLIVNCFQRAAGILHFINPSIWIANRAINRLREYACDDMASAYGDVSQVESGEAFLSVMRYAAAREHRGETRLEGALGMFELSGRASCFTRMKRLLDTNRRLSVKIRWGSLCLLLLTAALALPQMRAAAPQPQGPANSTNPPAKAEANANTTSPNSSKSSTAGQPFALTVLDAEGKPVPQATVEFRTDAKLTAEQVQRGKFIGKKRGSNYGGVLTQTDATGRIDLKMRHAPKSFEILIEFPGYGPFVAEWSSREHPISIPPQFTANLDAGWSVGGLLVDDQGKPIRGAKIGMSIQFKKPPEDTSELCIGTMRVTDAEGKWRFDSVPASINDFSVEITHPDFTASRVRLSRSQFGIAAVGKPAAKIMMQRGLIVVGKVVDEAGKPIANAVIRTEFVNDKRQAKTNEKGEYRLTGCEPAMARLVVWAKGRATDMKEVRVGPDIEPVNFTMQPGGKVRVRVLDDKGNPAARTRIFFQEWRGPFQYFEFDGVNEYADKNGIWQWNEAPLDDFQADICLPDGMQLVSRPLKARDEEYVFRGYAPLEIAGNVVDSETKAPINSFRVIRGLRGYTAWHAKSGKTHIDWIRHDSYVAKDGRYRVQFDREALAHLVRIEADGYLPAVSRDIKSDEGKVQLDFALKKGRDLVATVLTPDGKPAAGAKIALGVAGSQINITNGNIEDRSTNAARQETDAAGVFRLTPQNDAFQLIITHAAGYYSLKSAEKEVPSRIVLTPWARVAGTFRVGPRAMPNVVIIINAGGIESYGETSPHIFTDHKATTGSDGKFSFERVFPGQGRIGREMFLTVTDGATEVTSSVMTSATFTAGETMHVDLGGRGRPVVGKLTPPAGFKERVLWNFAPIDAQTPRLQLPAPAGVDKDTPKYKEWQNAYLAYQKTVEASPYISATVGRDGSFRIDDVPSGDYALSVRFNDHPAGHLLDYRFTVPPIEGNQVGRPLDLGELKLENN